MSGYIEGLFFWAFILLGFVFVPTATKLLVVYWRRPRDTALAIAFVAWCLGAPATFTTYTFASKWLRDEKLRELQTSYRALCEKYDGESIFEEMYGVKWIKLEVAEGSMKGLSALTAAFGSGFKTLLFGEGFYRNAESEEQNSHPHLIFRVRTKDHVPYAGTHYALEVEIEVIDSVANKILGRKRSFTSHGQLAGQSSSRDCRGTSLHDGNIRFVQRIARI